MNRKFTVEYKWHKGMIGIAAQSESDVKVTFNADGKAIWAKIGQGVERDAACVVRRLVAEFDHKYSSVEDTDTGIVVNRV